MATYNGVTYVKEQVESILNQLGVLDELIISDDSSTDDTVLLISQMTDPRIRFLGSLHYGSPVLNFENALRHATGQYIFLADQDDIWAPNKLAVVLPLLQQYDLVLTDCELVDKDGKLLHPSFFALRGSKPGFWYNMRRNSYMGCCMAFRRELLAQALPFPVRIHMHDWWIGLLAEVRGQVFFVRQPLLKYRRHGANASPTGEVGYSLWRQVYNRAWMAWSIVRRLAVTTQH